jgi:hypothetical protein
MNIPKLSIINNHEIKNCINQIVNLKMGQQKPSPLN